RGSFTVERSEGQVEAVVPCDQECRLETQRKRFVERCRPKRSHVLPHGTEPPEALGGTVTAALPQHACPEDPAQDLAGNDLVGARQIGCTLNLRPGLVKIVPMQVDPAEREVYKKA